MFSNRRQAGMQLATRLLAYADAKPIIYALPRGGLPVAEEIAKKLAAPLEIVLVRKLGAPGQEELAIGAVADIETTITILHRDVITELDVSDAQIEQARTMALKEIDRRKELYFKNRTPASPNGRTVIIADDGIATGATMEAAIDALRHSGAARIIVAAPVASPEAIQALEKSADEIIVIETPFEFWSVGAWYHSFPQLTDMDVIETLARHPAQD